MIDKPILWKMTDSEIMDELSRIEYWFGIESKDGTRKPYPTVDDKDIALSLIASALKRIMKKLNMDT